MYNNGPFQKVESFRYLCLEVSYNNVSNMHVTHHVKGERWFTIHLTTHETKEKSKVGFLRNTTLTSFGSIDVSLRSGSISNFTWDDLKNVQDCFWMSVFFFCFSNYFESVPIEIIGMERVVEYIHKHYYYHHHLSNYVLQVILEQCSTFAPIWVWFSHISILDLSLRVKM